MLVQEIIDEPVLVMDEDEVSGPGLAGLGRKQSDICRSGINGRSYSCFWCFRNFVVSITAQGDGGVALETVMDPRI